MIYKEKTTEVFNDDVVETLLYISERLFNKKAAERLLDSIERKTKTVLTNPYIYPLVRDKFLSKYGIRMKSINGYLMFYTIKADTVYILRFLYARRDWSKILKNDIKNQRFEDYPDDEIYDNYDNQSN